MAATKLYHSLSKKQIQACIFIVRNDILKLRIKLHGVFTMSTDGDIFNSKFATKSFLSLTLKHSSESQQIISSE